MTRARFEVAVFAAAASLAGIAAAANAAAPSPPTARCATLEYRQLDFWAGDWDAFDADAPEKPAARVRVVPILGGCALEEIYEGANGASGRSLSTYDAARRVWHQTWVSSRGQLLVLEGALSDGRLTLTATETLDGGKTVLWRGVWIPQADGVRETAVTSEDGGKTWTTRFDMLFRKRRS